MQQQAQGLVIATGEHESQCRVGDALREASPDERQLAPEDRRDSASWGRSKGEKRVIQKGRSERNEETVQGSWDCGFGKVLNRAGGAAKLLLRASSLRRWQLRTGLIRYAGCVAVGNTTSAQAAVVE